MVWDRDRTHPGSVRVHDVYVWIDVCVYRHQPHPRTMLMHASHPYAHVCHVYTVAVSVAVCMTVAVRVAVNVAVHVAVHVAVDVLASVLMMAVMHTCAQAGMSVVVCRLVVMVLRLDLYIEHMT